MNAQKQRASKHQIGRQQVSRTAGVVARTVQEAIDTGEAISVGAVNVVKHTALAALSGARDVGAEAGSVAVAAVRGSITAAGEIGNDLLNLLTQGGEKRPLAKATRRRRASARERTIRRSA
jgi:hypothetical protein